MADQPSASETNAGASDVRARYCPSCREPLRRFAFTGLFMPLEARAESLIRAFDDTDMMPFMPLGSALVNESFFIGVAGLCGECTHVSLWSLSHEEMLLMMDPEVRDKYHIEWVYEPGRIDRTIKRLEGKELPDGMLENLRGIVKLYAEGNG